MSSDSASLNADGQRFAANFITKVKASSDRDLLREFEPIPFFISEEYLSPSDRAPEIRRFNRYSDINPVAATRIVLKPPSDTEYVNANHIRGEADGRRYIAAQGPLPNTVAHFWRAVMQERVFVILMVTSLFEHGRSKCAQYWPEAGAQAEFEDVVVESLADEAAGGSPVIRRRTFRVAWAGAERTVTQVHFTGWPDHGVPDDMRVVDRLYYELYASWDQHVGSPLMVHCSAGIGRTGTFIAIDILVYHAALMRNEETADESSRGPRTASPDVGPYDVARIVTALRQQRSGMVQVDAQFVFVHRYFAQYLSRLHASSAAAPRLAPHPSVDATSATDKTEL